MMTTIVYYRKFSIGACWLRVWFIWSPRRRWCRLFTAVDASEVRSWIQIGADAENSLLWDEPPKETTEKQFENNECWSFCCCSSHFKQKIIMCISSDINGVAYKVMKCIRLCAWLKRCMSHSHLTLSLMNYDILSHFFPLCFYCS